MEWFIKTSNNIFFQKAKHFDSIVDMRRGYPA